MFVWGLILKKQNKTTLFDEMIGSKLMVNSEVKIKTSE